MNYDCCYMAFVFLMNKFQQWRKVRVPQHQKEVLEVDSVPLAFIL